jgi:hypothetical protein
MTRVVITGTSGTGKSTALAELARCGHRVVDADLPTLSTEIASPAGSGAEQLGARMRWTRCSLTTSPDGCSSLGAPQIKARFYDRFDAVVLFSVPREVLLHRIATRSTNPSASVLTSSNASWPI